MLLVASLTNYVGHLVHCKDHLMQKQSLAKRSKLILRAPKEHIDFVNNFFD